MSRFLVLSTFALASLASVMTSSCGDSSPAAATGPLTSAGGAGGLTGDAAMGSGGIVSSNGGSSSDGGASSDGGSPSNGGASSNGGAGMGTGGTPPVACTTDGQCAAPTPHCDTAGGFCVQCLGDPNCPMGQTCNTTTHRCVQCKTSGDCPNTTPYCDPDGQCVRCLTNDNCAQQNPPPGSPTLVCNQQSHTCITGCLDDAGCAQSFRGRKCDLQTNQCVQCLANSDCSTGSDGGQLVICTTTHTCTPGCASDADCPQNRRHCNTTTSLCVQCGSSADCGTTAPYCLTDNGTCVGCLTDANCANSGGVCNQQFHFCLCTMTSQCPQGMQCVRGQCF